MSTSSEVEQPPRSPLRLAPVDAAPGARLARAEEDVLRHREVVDERALLRHGRDPGGEGARGVAEAGLAAVERDAALVGGHLRGDDLQQRRLARAILAAEPVHLAREEGEARAAQGARAAVALVQALGDEHGGGSRGGSVHASAAL